MNFNFLNSEYRLFCKDSNYEKSSVEKTNLLLLLQIATAEFWREKNIENKTLKVKIFSRS